MIQRIYRAPNIGIRRRKSAWETEIEIEDAGNLNLGPDRNSPDFSYISHRPNQSGEPKSGEFRSGFLSSEEDHNALLNITESTLMAVLESMKLSTSYWFSCYKFVDSIKFRSFNTLSEKQQYWLEDIESDLRVEQTKQESKEAWKGADIKAAERGYNALYTANIGMGRGMGMGREE